MYMKTYEYCNTAYSKEFAQHASTYLYTLDFPVLYCTYAYTNVRVEYASAY